jgi:hypothetical protein
MLEEGLYYADHWGRVSIPSLRDKVPDAFYGSANFGDLVWSFGYCSLFYEWPYAMMSQYLRFGDRVMFDLADDMARHRYDIDQYHVKNAPPYIAMMQKYEKGGHGDLTRLERKRANKYEYNASPSHTWNRGLLLYWVLTGDKRAHRVALDNGQAFYNFFFRQHKLGKKDKAVYREFRTPGWAMEAWMGLYEYTGDTRYLEWANEIFSKSLLSMEKDNGSCGHIRPEGTQSSQFVAYIIEPTIRLHHITGREDTIGFLQRVLDWHRDKAITGGKMVGDKYRITRFVRNWKLVDSPAGDCWANIHYAFQFSDGYAFLYEKLGRPKDLDFARRMFRDGMFFYSMPEDECDIKERGPLGYHLKGSTHNMCPKVHAFIARHCQVFLMREEAEPGSRIVQRDFSDRGRWTAGIGLRKLVPINEGTLGILVEASSKGDPEDE